MAVGTVSSRMLATAGEKRAVTAFTQRILEERGLGQDACDFVFGNPQEPPLRGLVEALIRHAGVRHG
jgi:aspartate aminotransferase